MDKKPPNLAANPLPTIRHGQYADSAPHKVAAPFPVIFRVQESVCQSGFDFADVDFGRGNTRPLRAVRGWSE